MPSQTDVMFVILPVLLSAVPNVPRLLIMFSLPAAEQYRPPLANALAEDILLFCCPHEKSILPRFLVSRYYTIRYYDGE